ncbi:DinB family protein [Fulvivirga kasyanovii]|uniref:DinB family protein n=1 Tax=Fulvivirga kasyanovii TaxID=396812 RepID=A0ABW9RX61_9BACT|nr:DinB family protein [Fulvivirga kasyanovii]MTI27600.1 DinB family protein [Fulvivirga kasyanovii]
MNTIDIILLNFSETRRRSLKLWQAIPDDYLGWRPDKDAFSIIEMIRHVLEGEHLFHKIIENRGNLGDYESPWSGEQYSDVNHELSLAEKYRARFIDMVKNLKEDELENVEIVRTEVGQRKKLGDYLNRMAYHESVHAGQMLGYLRSLNIDRPLIWD